MRRRHAAEVTEQRGANHIPAAGPAGPCWACGVSRLKAGARKFSAKDARAEAGVCQNRPYLYQPRDLYVTRSRGTCRPELSTAADAGKLSLLSSPMIRLSTGKPVRGTRANASSQPRESCRYTWPGKIDLGWADPQRRTFLCAIISTMVNVQRLNVVGG